MASSKPTESQKFLAEIAEAQKPPPLSNKARQAIEMAASGLEPGNPRDEKFFKMGFKD